jgi:transposase
MNYHSLIAIDLAKNVFQVCTMSTNNHVLMNESFNRKGLTEFMLNQPASVVAMEACYSSHYWARLFKSFGHQVKLFPTQHVQPFVRGNKNDHNDALAIAEASQRPGIKAVPIKTVAQQDIQSLHRLRERCVSQRTSLSNQTRGLLSEYGIVFPAGLNRLNKHWPYY